MQRINYKSDFDFILRLRDCKGDAVGFPGYDWEARLWTPQNKANAYTASCRGGVCENCYNDNGEIHIVCDGHRLGLGQLCAELTVELPNGIYPDGYRKRVEPQLLDIELVNDAGDSPTEAQTEVAVAYAVIDAYDMAVASGYEGTREEYTASLGMLPDLAATVSDLRQGLQSLTELSLPSLVTATGTVASDCPALTELSLSNLEEAFSADAFGKLDNVVALSLPKLKRLYVGSSSLRLPKITSLTLPSVEYIFLSTGFLTRHMPNLNELRLPSAVTITGNGGLLRGARDIDVYLPKVITFTPGITWSNKNVRIHFGSQTGVSFDLNNAAVTAITIEPGFTGSIDFKSAVLTADNLRELLVNLGDNTDGATMRIQMGANNLAKLTEDEIAVATAKNYTVS